MFRKIPDNFFFGLALGAGTLSLCAGLIQYVRLRLFTENEWPPYWQEPRPELVSLILNIILFRFLMLRLKVEQTGKGVLFITVVLVMIYYFGKLKH